MTTVLRLLAIALAVAAFVDPALTRRLRAPLPVELVLPAFSDPTFHEARAFADEIEADLDGIATLTSPDPPGARVVVGNGNIPTDLAAPIYVVGGGKPSARALVASVHTDGDVVPGQSVTVSAEVRGEGLAGRRSTIALLDRGVTIVETGHVWTSDDERLVARLAYVPARGGVHPLTVEVRTPGIDEVARADTAAVAVDRPLRVLVYEPRPSWAAAFARRALERDPAFVLAVLSRSGREIATRVGAAPRAVEALDSNAFDVLVVGAPDALTPGELAALDRFTSERGGALLLVPDRRLPPAVRDRFDLPAMDELLLEKPVPVHADGLTLHASELLLPRDREGAYTSLAAVEESSATRAAVVAVAHGEGTVVMSGLLDAWRHRRLQDAATDAFWRGLVAELALTAPRRLELRLDPHVARPGDLVKVIVTWRRDAIMRAGEINVPPTSASMTDAAGARHRIRLWPGTRAGVFEASIIAPAAGLHPITVASDGATADALLRVDEQIVQARGDGVAAARFAAAASGGEIVRDSAELVARLRAVDKPEIVARAHPMRSPLWILPFAGCLCAEWFMRRRRGLR